MTDLDDPKTWLPDASRLAAIRDAIDAYNAERPAIARTHTWRMALMVGGYALAAAILIYVAFLAQSGIVVGVTVAAAVYGGKIIWKTASEPARRFQQELRGRLFPVIFGFIPQFSYDTGTPPEFLSDFERTGFAAWSKALHDDRFAGTHNGRDFECCEIELFTGSGRSERVLFNGLILRVRLTDRFDGVLLAQSKTNAVHRYFRDLFGSRFFPVESGIPDVDATHEFRTDRESEAQRQRSVEVAKVLDWLQGYWRHGPAQIVLSGHSCYLLLAGNVNHFELPHIDAGDLVFDRDILPLIRDMVTLLAFADLIGKIGRA